MESAGVGQGIGEGPNGTIREAFLNAAKFWEPRRVIYNMVLALVVVAWVGFSWPHFRPMFRWQGLLFLVVMALLANACYCAAYVVEFAMQGSPMSSGLPIDRSPSLWVCTARSQPPAMPMQVTPSGN